MSDQNGPRNSRLNEYESGTVSLSAYIEGKGDATVGVFPKGLDTTFSVTKKEVLILITGEAVINGNKIEPGSCLTFDPALGVAGFAIRCPTSDVIYASLYF
ncbi:MAG: hypothetical protein HGA38_04525 [Candidatus Moranbacteria bacterium]|nr:hypothetical protein [Candidatus Moranbacteria bacterium]NTW45912.1 hypothetical protein [Candidatus Moranbacteria bacterium]